MHTPDGSGKQEVSTHLFFRFVGCQESRTTEGPAPGELALCSCHFTPQLTLFAISTLNSDLNNSIHRREDESGGQST